MVCSLHILVIVVVNVVEAAPANKCPSGAVNKGVVPDMPCTHLIIEVHCLDGDVVRRNPNAALIEDVQERVVPQLVPWVDERVCLLPASVKPVGRRITLKERQDARS